MYEPTFLHTAEEVLTYLRQKKTVYFVPLAKESWRTGKIDPHFYTGMIYINHQVQIRLQYHKTDKVQTLPLEQLESIVERIIKHHPKVYVYLYPSDFIE